MLGYLVGAVFVGCVLFVIIVLPVIALRRNRAFAPPDRDAAFVQQSERPMPDRSYLGQGLGGM